MALIDEYNAVVNAVPDLQHRIQKAISNSALDIFQEAVDYPNHNNRLNWAWRVIVDPVAIYDEMKWAVFENPTIVAQGNAATDGDIIFVVNSLIDNFAPH